MSIFGGLPPFRPLGLFTSLRVKNAQVGAPTGSMPTFGNLNAEGLQIQGVPVQASDVSIISGATHSPALADHGKTFIYTNAGAVTVTLPAASGLFAGWNIGLVSAATGSITVNRSSTDVIFSKNTSLTSMQLPMAGNGGRLYLDSTGGSARFYWQGLRSSALTDTLLSSIDTAATNLAHNLGVVPDKIKAEIICSTANLNYSVNDVVDLAAGSDDTNATANGFIIMHDTTNCVVRAAGMVLQIPNKTTFANAAITTGSWKTHFTAFAWN